MQWETRTCENSRDTVRETRTEGEERRLARPASPYCCRGKQVGPGRDAAPCMVGFPAGQGRPRLLQIRASRELPQAHAG